MKTEHSYPIEKATKPHLPVHEWMAVIAIIIFLGTLTLAIILVPQKDAELYSEPHFMASQTIEVMVEGAIENPGLYTLQQGGQVKDLLKMVKLLPDADLKTLKHAKKLKNGERIKIPQLKMITVQILGAVKTPTTIKMTKGARLQDLLETVNFQENADLSKLKRKRVLKDGEIIEVTFINDK